MTKFTRSVATLLLLPLLVLALAGCSPLQPRKSPSSVAAPVIPPLSPELKKEPEPSGSYWKRVTEWQKVWGETLKTLQPKSEVSSGSTGH
jgi:hypothetical protein